jgi:hypothetical protein
MINLGSILRVGAPAKEVGGTLGSVVPNKKKPLIDMSQSWFGGPRSTAQAPAPIQDDAPLPVIQNNGIIPRQTPMMMPPMAAPPQQQYGGGQNDLLRVVQGQQQPFGGFMAQGGQVDPGTAYVVGENGPETYKPQPIQPINPMDPGMMNSVTMTEQRAPYGQSVRRTDVIQTKRGKLIGASEVPDGYNPSEGVGRPRRPQHRAYGGPVDRKKPYIVGENGPELFVPDQRGEIIPNPSTTPDTPPATPPQPAPAGDVNELLRVSEAAKQGNQYISPLAQANAGAALPPPPAQPASAYQPAEPITDPQDPRMQQGLDQLTAIGQNAAAQGRMPNALLRTQQPNQMPISSVGMQPSEPMTYAAERPTLPLEEAPPPGLISKPAAAEKSGPRTSADIEDAIANTYQDSGKREKSFLKRFESGFGSAYHNWQPGEGSGGILGLLLGSTIGGVHAAASPREAEAQQRQSTRTDLIRRLPIAQNEEKFNIGQENTGSEIQKRQDDAALATKKFIEESYDKDRAFALQKYNASKSYKKGQDPMIDRLGLPEKTEKDAWQLHVVDDGNSKRMIAFNPRTLESKELSSYAKSSSGNPEKDYPDELFGLDSDKALEDRAKGTVDPGTKTYKLKQNANIPNAFIDENGNFDQPKYWDAYRKGKTTVKPTEIFDETNDYGQRLSAETSRLRDEQKGNRQEVAKFRAAVSGANGNVPASKTDIVGLFNQIMAEKDQGKRSAMLTKLYARIPSLRIQ